MERLRTVPTTPTNRIAYRAFRDTEAFLEDIHRVYNALYPVQTITLQHELDDPYAFEYCRQRRYFVLVVPYTTHRHLLVERAFASNQLTWVLLGGSCRHDLMETFIDAADRYGRRGMTNIELGEIEPIAFLRNEFQHEGKTCVHEGIAFVARIRNHDPASALRQTIHSRAHFVPASAGTRQYSLTHNAEVVQLVESYLRKVDFASVPESEIALNQQYKSRYRFHSAVVKPLLRAASRILFRYSLDDLDRAVLATVENGSHSSILDVACGENRLVFDFARLPHADLVVGNDVSWSQVQLMSEHLGRAERFRNLSSFLLFTNHDARRLPFSDGSFDFVFCKNVLHHMDSAASLSQLMQEMLRVGKRLLIVEIMDPTFEGSWGRLRHRYYTQLLHDAGENFLSWDEFDVLTKSSRRCKLFKMETIRGIYQFAEFREDIG